MNTAFTVPPGTEPGEDVPDDPDDSPPAPPTAEACANCAAPHATWRCPEIGRLLFDTTSAIIAHMIEDNAELSLFDKLRGFKKRIAELRGLERHWQAAFMRDELLCEIEHWVDPAGLEHRAMLQRIQGEAAVELALAVSDECGF
jgi:hypothetical protein